MSISQPKCLQCRINTYSHYKKGYTIKYVIGVSPGGLVTHVSQGYGGRASDEAIFQQSNLVSQLLPGIDHVMVDKGFLIEDVCESCLIEVIRPPFLQQKQLSKAEALRTKKIATARVHVERAIQRIKIFKILSQKMPWSMVPLADDIVCIAAALVNLSKPILVDKRFM
ncbi:uncharacterized protein LOC115319400 [Ixodes scapularis]|uniref:uncharacterized protein LOC115319400 n=1 Tax=Ixodes scapularis TaxID=6945 RepID=UPI001A9D53C2|nr:uncharacterized protein LOC115319400 [Ixodes scapularis]